MGRLSKLKVERTDAVANPATGLTWVVVKSEDAEAEEIAKTEDAARAVLEALAKEGIELSEGAVDALRNLAETLELEYEFKQKGMHDGDGEPTSKDEDEPEADEEEADDEAEAEEDGEVEKGDEPDDDSPVTLGMLKALLSKSSPEPDADEPTPYTTRIVTRSKQPRESASKVEKAADATPSDLFSNIVYGD